MKKLNSFRKPCLESLEDRTLLAVTAGGFELAAPLPEPAGATAWIVNTTDDAMEWDTADDILSLREAIGRAQTGDTITFDESLAGGTITLCGNQLEINEGIIIDATSIGGITIDAYDQSRVFYINTGRYGSKSVELISLTITGGWADSGGGIYNIGNLTVMNSTIAKNTASHYGGGINNYQGSFTITDSIITENDADYGGGIFNSSGGTTVRNSTISENIANSGGGIYNNSSLTVIGSTISGNNVGGIGGGIYNVNTAHTTVIDSIISGNTAHNGGGIYKGIWSYVTVVGSTIAGNMATESGGGIYQEQGYQLTITNTIVSFNYAGYNHDICAEPGGNTGIVPTSGSNNIIGFDPGFVTAPVFENGVLVNADELDLSLRPESLAIDAGTNAAVETETDFSGNPRIFAAWRETPTVDIGAYEYQETVAQRDIEAPSTVVTTQLDLLDETDGLISLREAILYAAAGETITFDVSLASRTIVLVGVELTIDKSLSIDASAIGGITIDADGKSRNFFVGSDSGRISVNLTSLSIQNGYGQGNAVYNYSNSNLTLTNCAVTMKENTVGCVIYNDSGTITAVNSTFTHRFYARGGTITFYNSIVTGSLDVSDSRTYAYNTLSYFTNWTRSQNCPTYDWSLPLFADPDHNDYTLAENSQAINAGNNSYVTAETDLAGNPRILNGTVDLGAYEYTGLIEPLDAPTILTGQKGYYVSYGANRHQVTWSAVDRAAAYEFAYSEDGGSTWTTLETNDTSAVVRGLSYGSEVSYRVRALSTRYLENSDWSAVKSFLVCPMDVNGDGDISGADRVSVSLSWLAEEGNEAYRYYADINGDGDISGADRNLLSANWLNDADDPYLLYPRPVAADMVFAEFASADLGVDLDEF